MTSLINTEDLNLEFPTKNINNDSQVFRDNFTNIKQNLDFAKNEISNLQNPPVSVVTTLTELRNLDVSDYNTNDIVHVLGYYGINDLGGGFFAWDPDSMLDDPSGSLIVTPASSSGRWIRIIDDLINLRWFGAKGDNTTDDSLALQFAVQYSNELGYNLYAPAGDYIIGTDVGSITLTLSSGNFTIIGDGPGKTNFIELAGKTGEFDSWKMFEFLVTGAASQIQFSNLTINKTGSLVLNASTSSSVLVSIDSLTGDLTSLIFDNVVFENKIGTHINIEGKHLGNLTLRNVGTFPTTINETSSRKPDIVVSALTDNFNIDHSQLDLVKCISAIVDEDNTTNCFWNNSTVNEIVVEGESLFPVNLKIHLSDITVNKISLKYCSLFVNSSTIGLGNDHEWAFVNGKISNSTINVYVSGAVFPWNINSQIISGPQANTELHISNSIITGDLVGSPPGYAISSTEVKDENSLIKHHIIFDRCEFDERFERVLNANRRGEFTFFNCNLSGQEAFATVGSGDESGSDAVGIVNIYSCSLDRIQGDLFEFEFDINKGSVNIFGEHLLDLWQFSDNGTLAADAFVNHNGMWYTTSIPVNTGTLGQVAKLINSLYTGDVFYVYNVKTGDTEPDWHPLLENAVTQIYAVMAANKLELEGLISDEEDARDAAIVLEGQRLEGIISDNEDARDAAIVLESQRLEDLISDEENARVLAVNGEAGIRDAADDALQVQIDNIVTVSELTISKYASLNNVAIDTGLVNAYVVDNNDGVDPPLLLGTKVRFKALNANTAASTINYNSSGVKSVVQPNGSPILAGDIRTTTYNEVTYDGTNWILISLDRTTVTDMTPAGCVMAFAGNTAPAGWLECDGSSLLRASYPNLFSAIGVTYGSVGTLEFTLPDMRGEFLRGWDHGRGVDSGRVRGSSQAEGVGSHGHTIQMGADTNDPIPVNINNAVSTSVTAVGSGLTGSLQIADSTGTENRPRNIAMMFIIKI